MMRDLRGGLVKLSTTSRFTGSATAARKEAGADAGTPWRYSMKRVVYTRPDLVETWSRGPSSGNRSRLWYVTYQPILLEWYLLSLPSGGLHALDGSTLLTGRKQTSQITSKRKTVGRLIRYCWIHRPRPYFYFHTLSSLIISNFVSEFFHLVHRQ